MRKLCILHKINQGHCPVYFNNCLEYTSNTRSWWQGACNSRTKPMSRHFYRRSYFCYTFSFVKERQFRSSDVVKSFSVLWLSWHSHGSLIPRRFYLKINRSMKTPWLEYSGVACSYSKAPVNTNNYHTRCVFNNNITTSACKWDSGLRTFYSSTCRLWNTLNVKFGSPSHTNFKITYLNFSAYIPGIILLIILKGLRHQLGMRITNNCQRPLTHKHFDWPCAVWKSVY